MNRTLERGITWALALALVISLFATGFLALNPEGSTEAYTEFYVLGPNGNATGYPTDLSVGETGTVIVGVSNHEQREQTYTVLAQVDNRTVKEQTVTVADGETWEDELSFTVESAGQKQVRLLLFEGNSVRDVSDPYRHLRLRVNVSARS